MTRFLLDRDVLSAAETPRGNPHVRTWIRGLPITDLFISSVTVMEARKGFARLQANARNPADIGEIPAYQTSFDELVTGFDERILVIDRPVAERWGEMLGRREANVMDTAIAATVAVHGLVVATRNLRHFRGRGVRLLDPFKARPIIE